MVFSEGEVRWCVRTEDLRWFCLYVWWGWLFYSFFRLFFLFVRFFLFFFIGVVIFIEVRSVSVRILFDYDFFDFEMFRNRSVD